MKRDFIKERTYFEFLRMNIETYMMLVSSRQELRENFPFFNQEITSKNFLKYVYDLASELAKSLKRYNLDTTNETKLELLFDKYKPQEVMMKETENYKDEKIDNMISHLTKEFEDIKPAIDLLSNIKSVINNITRYLRFDKTVDIEYISDTFIIRSHETALEIIDNLTIIYNDIKSKIISEDAIIKKLCKLMDKNFICFEDEITEYDTMAVMKKILDNDNNLSKMIESEEQ